LHVASELKTSYTGEDFEEIALAVVQSISGKHGIVPSVVYLLQSNSLPKTSSGKVQRIKTRTYVERGLLNVKYVWKRKIDRPKPKNGALINWMKSEVAALTGISASLVDENKALFDLGVESILFPELIDKVKERTGKSLPIHKIIEEPSITGIALFLESIESEDQSATKQKEKIQSSNENDNSDIVFPDFE